MIGFSGEMKPEDMRHLFSEDGLIRTETSVLQGLLLKSQIDFTVPSEDLFREYVRQTESLLKELHDTMSAPFMEHLAATPEQKNANPFQSGAVLREPIFYGGESAHTFQYRDLSIKKYSRDDKWLNANMGFTVAEAVAVVRAIERTLDSRGAALLGSSKAATVPPELFLRSKTFSVEEVATASGIDLETTTRVISAFAAPAVPANSQFASLHDFNIANAQPLIQDQEGGYILFNHFSLAEALYESPFYWMLQDRSYSDTSLRNRGLFGEEFAAARLSRVFGSANVYSNVDVFDSSHRKVGEIDVLVLFGDRAIVVQAKSKRLTIESRRGNDGQIRDDFKKAIQDSYDQGLKCAKALRTGECVLKDAGSGRLISHGPLGRVYIVNVVADHYPALSFQARHFLQTETVEGIFGPLVLHAFALDEITEMLESPLQLLSYLTRRTMYGDRVAASDERVILAYHLKQNLWLDDEHDLVMFADDIAIDLDLAMIVRREGIPGKGTPEGILTRLAGSTLWRWIGEIEAQPHPSTLALGEALLTLGEDTFLEFSRGIDEITARARGDGKSHDFTIGISQGGIGFTVHCTHEPPNVAGPVLARHCRARKYTEKAGRWFGICVRPIDGTVLFALDLNHDWVQSDEMDRVTSGAPRPKKLAEGLRASRKGPRKVGRNEPCPCLSGKKYKKCCLHR